MRPGRRRTGAGDPDLAPAAATAPDVNGRSEVSDPNIARAMVLDFAWPEQQATSGDAPAAPRTVKLIIHDERRSDDLVFGGSWGPAETAAVVTLDCPDRRKTW